MFTLQISGPQKLSRAAMLFLAVGLNVLTPLKLDAVVVPGPTLTVGVEEQANGNATLSLQGTSGARSNNTVNQLTTEGGTRPPHSGPAGVFALPAGLVVTNLSGGSAQISQVRVTGTQFIFETLTPFAFANGDIISGSGEIRDAMPFAGFIPGSTTIFSTLFNVTYVVIPFTPSPVTASPSAPSPAAKEESFILANVSAIASAEAGVTLTAANKAAIQNIYYTAIGDLNDRLFKARADYQGGGTGLVRSDSSTSRYLQFAQSQNIDYRVALGLVDGVEVPMADSLAAGNQQIGGMFTLVGAPVNLGSASVVSKAVIADAVYGKNPMEGKEVLPFEEVTMDYEIFTEFDFGFYEQDILTKRVRGFEIDSYAATIGFEYDINPGLTAGVAWSHAWSDAELNSNLGGIDIEGNLVSAYVSAAHGNTWGDLLYSYGDFNHSTNRNNLLGGRAFGETESSSHNVAANLGHHFHLSEKLVTGPLIGMDYHSGEVDGYTERGGGPANLIFSDTEYESLIGRIGWTVSHTQPTKMLGKMTTQLRAGWGHEFMPDDEVYTATLLNSPFALFSGGSSRSIGSYTAEGGGAHPGQDWIELGTGLRFDFNQNWNLRFDYEGQFGRNNARAHFGTARIGYQW